jgi:cyclophilin family peptidyl-prolyl cis-trans isomerase
MAADAMAMVEYFHFEMDAKLSLDVEGTKLDIPITMEGDYEAPDRSQGSVLLSVVFFEIESKFITIGDTTYVTNPDTGEWEIGQSPELLFADPREFADPEFLRTTADFAELVLIGTEALNGLEVYRLSGVIVDEDSGDNFMVDFWIDVEDNLISQVTVSGSLNVEDADAGDLLGDLGAGDAAFEAVITFSAYDEPVSIDAPDGLASDEPVDSGSVTVLTEVLDSGNVSYTLPDEQFTITLPSTWEMVPLDIEGIQQSLKLLEDSDPALAERINEQIDLLQGAGNFILYAFDTDASIENIGLTSVNVLKEDAGFNVALGFYADFSVQQIAFLPGFVGGVQRERVDLNGLPAEELKYSLTVPVPEESGVQFTDGVYQVGNDIQPGTYRNNNSTNSCYWKRLSGFSGEINDTIASDITDVNVIVTIKASDAGFSSERCGTWSEIEEKKLELALTQYLFTKGSVLYAITLSTTADKNADLTPIFKEIGQSFGFVESLGLSNGQDETTEAKTTKQYDSPPAMTIDTNKDYSAKFVLANGGEFTIDLFEKDAPITVNNFVFLAREGFYDGVTFHRVIEGFMAQGGDPTGTSTGGPGYFFENEFHPDLRHTGPGILSMANKGIRNGQGTNGSQFFITFRETMFLDGLQPDGSAKPCTQSGASCHTVFGIVTDGMDIVYGIPLRDPVTALTPGESIVSLTIVISDSSDDDGY